jgi:transposase
MNIPEPCPLPTLIAERLVPDYMWQVVEARLPPPARRRQGGGRGRADARPCLVVIAYVITAGVAWRRLPRELGVDVGMAYRRWVEWTAVGLRAYLPEIFDDSVEVITPVDSDLSWIRAVARAALRRVEDNQAYAPARIDHHAVPALNVPEAREEERRVVMNRFE